jgi:GDP-4-dehydro-6-deoxy-D-mannose reductase
MLETLVDFAGIEPEITYDPARMRPTDTPVVYGSHERITAETGWKPEIPIEQSLADALADWLERI